MRFFVGLPLVTCMLAGISAQAHAQAVTLLSPAPEAGAKEGLQLSPSLVTAYEDNIYRTKSDKVDDVIITPTLEARFRRTFGQSHLSLGGLFGYDFFVQQSQRNKPRIVVSGDGSVAVAGTCAISPAGYYRL